MPPSRPSRSGAFAPGRVNLIGEHTDYNCGLALPFAIAEGVTVRAEALPGERIQVHARDLGERDEFALDDRSAAAGWRAFVRGTVAERSGSVSEMNVPAPCSDPARYLSFSAVRRGG